MNRPNYAREPKIPRSVYQDKIDRLEARKEFARVRLVAARDTKGSYADYLIKRIRILSLMIMEARKEMEDYYGNNDTSTESKNHRIDRLS